MCQDLTASPKSTSQTSDYATSPSCSLHSVHAFDTVGGYSVDTVCGYSVRI